MIIKLYPCKNGHVDNVILLNESSKIGNIFFINKLKCDICNIIYDDKNEFFYCHKCKCIICLSCKEKHDNTHIVIKYENKNYICKEHNQKYNSYCKKCNINICLECNEQHKNHDLIHFDKMIPDI